LPTRSAHFWKVKFSKISKNYTPIPPLIPQVLGTWRLGDLGTQKPGNPGKRELWKMLYNVPWDGI